MNSPTERHAESAASPSMAPAPVAGAKKVFISHSSHDKPFVDRLVTDLAKSGIPVWCDKLDLRIGESIPGRINDGLADAEVLPDRAVSALRGFSLGTRGTQFGSHARRQVAAGGTFSSFQCSCRIVNVPPLLSHRRFADFRKDYDGALSELLSIWNKDCSVSAQMENKALYPWPDIEAPDAEHVYLHSSRFDKFFRMSCPLDWTLIAPSITLSRHYDCPGQGVAGIGNAVVFQLRVGVQRQIDYAVNNAPGCGGDAG